MSSYETIYNSLVGLFCFYILFCKSQVLVGCMVYCTATEKTNKYPCSPNYKQEPNELINTNQKLTDDTSNQCTFRVESQSKVIRF